VPAPTTVQVPLAHESQAPPQAVLQQTPSTQLPVLHWLPFEHGVPLPYLQSMSWVAPQVALHERDVTVQTKVQLATVPDLVLMVLLSLVQASDWVWQAEGGSHFSPASITEFPHTAVQSLSLLALQADGQQPSPFLHVVVTVVFTHLAVQAVAVPCNARCWHPMAGQVVGQLAPSQLSLQAGSVTPLPHWQAQSLSFAVVHPEAQQLSPFVQAVMTVSFTHTALHAVAVPCRCRVWQPIAGQVAGQLPSQVSPESTIPSPQRGLQSLSLLLLQPAGQQPSPFAQAVWTPSSMQLAVQAAAEPTSFRRMQAFQGQVAGQLEGGSQVSPASIAPLPQWAVQSLSTLALQAAGQQPSPDVQAVCTTSSTHWAWQVPPLTRRRFWQPIAGQAAGQLESGSQVSWQAASICPLPQVQLQSASVAVVQPDGQQPSPEAQTVWAPSSMQCAVQSAAVPVSFRFVQPMAGQVVGQLPGGSQLSPASSTPLPQAATQSLSLVALQPGGQQPSPLMHVVCRWSLTQVAMHVPGLATRRSMHPTGAHADGQVESGSHTSPHAASTMPLPQVQLQSLSWGAAQPEGQQASPEVQAVSVPLRTQIALQPAADPCSS
jgi:hypothetical protein